MYIKYILDRLRFYVVFKLHTIIFIVARVVLIVSQCVMIWQLVMSDQPEIRIQNPPPKKTARNVGVWRTEKHASANLRADDRSWKFTVICICIVLQIASFIKPNCSDHLWSGARCHAQCV